MVAREASEPIFAGERNRNFVPPRRECFSKHLCHVLIILDQKYLHNVRLPPGILSPDDLAPATPVRCSNALSRQNFSRDRNVEQWHTSAHGLLGEIVSVPKRLTS